MGFQERKSLHDELCDWLVRYLNEEKGLPSVHYGAEHSIEKRIRELLRGMYDPTACFIRHQPDILAVINKKAAFMEVKTLTRDDTKYFSIETDSLKVLKAMSKPGVLCVVIFYSPLELYRDNPKVGLKCCFAKDMHASKKRGLHKPNHPNESGTAYSLIRKNAPYLMSLDEIIQKIEKNNAHSNRV